MKKTLKTVLKFGHNMVGKKVLKKLGYELKVIPKNENVLPLDMELSMQGALWRCNKRGLNVKSVIDVGASDGRWARDCMSRLPTAKYLLIEAQEAHKDDLLKLKTENPNVDYVLAAAGNRQGKIYFQDQDLLGGVASDTPFEEYGIEVPVTIIDLEVSKRKLEPPYLIKLDTHGFEVPILEGAKESIKNAELIIIEAYNYKLIDGCLRFFELCHYIEKLGFSCIEIVDMALRPYDSSCWQMDIFFIPSTRKEFEHIAYQ